MALPARRTALGLNSAFVTQAGEELVLKEKLASLSGDSFSVMTADNRAIVQVKGEAFSLSGRKHVLDMNGNNLFDIRKEHFTLFSAYYCEDANKQKVLEVKSKFASKSMKPTLRLCLLLLHDANMTAMNSWLVEGDHHIQQHPRRGRASGAPNEGRLLGPQGADHRGCVGPARG